MSRIRIKFCGITRVADAQAAVALGVDAIGLVLTQKSLRFAGLDRAREIRQSLPPFVTAVALFMDDEPGWIAAALSAIQPDLLQFHGNESAAECLCYGRPYLKAVAMGGGLNPGDVIAAHPQAAGFVLDGHAAGAQGGSGKVFDWPLAPKQVRRPLILAGGLTCDNVAAAIRAVQPYAVDVSSGIEAGGIESAPGIKDADKMRRFIDAVTRACDKSYEVDKWTK
jgi:phosphoribosylanthranilate isomerase